MTPEEKKKFWMEVYVAAIRAFQIGAVLGGHGTSIKQATEYASSVADKALDELNRRLQSPTHFR